MNSLTSGVLAIAALSLLSGCGTYDDSDPFSLSPEPSPAPPMQVAVNQAPAPAAEFQTSATPELGASAAPTASGIEQYREEAVRDWSADIQHFNELNQSVVQSPDAILCIGSSSFRLWETMADDLAPYQIIRRGFGGSRWSDVAVFADELITPHQFRAVLFFVGNDIAGDARDKSPAEVASLFRHVSNRVRAHNPFAHIFVIPVTPTESRAFVWPLVQEANSAIRSVCQSLGNATYIPTADLFQGPLGEAKPELFREDRLHLNKLGYTLWSQRILQSLDASLGQ